MPQPNHLLRALNRGDNPPEVVHTRILPERDAVTSSWPEWLHPNVVDAFQGLGVPEPYRHQVLAADAAHSAQARSVEYATECRSSGRQVSTGRGDHVIVATGTASGKSLAYQMPTLDAIVRGGVEPGSSLHSREATVLYLAPTKALAADQLASVRSLEVPHVRADTYDGDTEFGERSWIRDHSNFVLCNPDMLHAGVLPNHERWARFLRQLRYVIVDEAHGYRGVFGAHVSMVLRRLRRICALHGSSPTFIGASATSADPQRSFSRLLGVEEPRVSSFVHDDSPHGSVTVLLWEPLLEETVSHDGLAPSASGVPETTSALPAPSSPTSPVHTRGFNGAGPTGAGENGAPRRRSALSEAAEMLTDLVAERIRTIAFIKSRRGAETMAGQAQDYLQDIDPSVAHRVCAYRSGYLPEERRELERQVRSGEMLGVASTPALELGIDVAGLDAVLVAGWPGTRASFFQQIGRAGRAGQESLAVFVASDDPLDTYLAHHPRDIFDTTVESTVFDPSNPYVLAPHLCSAAAERPLRLEELSLFGPTTESVLDTLVRDGYLRRRPTGWFWTHPESAAEMVDIRSGGGHRLQIIDAETGGIIGTMESGQSHYQAHPGAIYVHQGKTWHVEELDEESRAVVVSRAHPNFYTQARDVTEVSVLETEDSRSWGPVTLNRGLVRVRTQVVSFQRKALSSNDLIDEEPLDLDAQELVTRAVWWTIPPTLMTTAGVVESDVPGALHAAEHASIGLLPLVATCDRWDIGGLSTALHVDTEMPTIFVYDGYPGGAGFTEHGFFVARSWLEATLEAIVSCECENGCPSCVQSPKCGNKNNPLSKSGAVALLRGMLAEAAPDLLG
ncbi:Zn-binding domain-containing protein [Rothia uropygialis]|uniref:Zn-binding domain-containing protein n=1 Tax=Kocuria sp. 36 TaxID=1415402 RepID=UPI00101D7F0A|nr:DEAD/DEAH box helicase [Kocuria sp. 36]